MIQINDLIPVLNLGVKKYLPKTSNLFLISFCSFSKIKKGMRSIVNIFLADIVF